MKPGVRTLRLAALVALTLFALPSGLPLPQASLAALGQMPVTHREHAGEWTQRAPAAMPSARDEHGMAYDSARGVTVLFGGQSAAAWGLDDTWEWDGASWLLRSPTASPSERQSPAMAYDSGRGVSVLFGGLDDSGHLGDTWEWDGEAWLERTPASAPSARLGHAMVYDAVRGVTVLFGGKDDWGFKNDTWEWDGGAWLERTPVAVPIARLSPAMAYDAGRGVAVLFGGYDPVSGYSLGDTWEWDGADWVQRAPEASPPARSSHAMTYDAERGVTILFGGTGNYGHLGDTWEWDGTDWHESEPVTAPPIRYSSAMAYDTAREVAVLFGGGYYSGGFRYLDDTWEYGVPQYWTVYAPAILRSYSPGP